MSYLVFARKYRPQRFAELVGQEHVTRTLENAFRLNKIAQAYLFTGTRGVGKTSIGRILARALRCEDPKSQPGQPNYGIPCNQCPSCLEVSQPGSLDVLEIDGASNNGVDNVREIRESVKFAPSKGTKKVYIIDEVHMLTGAAFNALLKTLEEPPPHAVFVLATTEAQKIPQTILSRCQRFDLKRVPTSTICDYLGRIVLREEMTAHPEALQLIARKADGSIRDALSLLDQVVANCGKNLDIEGTISALGIVRSQTTLTILEQLARGDGAAAVAELQKSFDAGTDLKTLMTDLLETTRNAILLQNGVGRDALGLLADEAQTLTNIGAQSNRESLQAIFQILHQTLAEMLRSPVPKAVLDVALVRAASMRSLTTVQELLARMQRFENLLKNPVAVAAGTAIATGINPGPAAASARPTAMSAPLGAALGVVGANAANGALGTPVANGLSASATKAGFGGAGGNADAGNGELSWQGFVRYASQKKPSLGSLLEHALPLTPPADWQKAQVEAVRLGFRENQGFQYEQAKSPVVLSGIERLLGDFLGQQRKVLVEKIANAERAAAAVAPKSIVDGKIEREKQRAEALKKQFLEQAIIQDTREIFGAEVTSFDISSGNDSD